jgi:hypothetical protein
MVAFSRKWSYPCSLLLLGQRPSASSTSTGPSVSKSSSTGRLLEASFCDDTDHIRNPLVGTNSILLTVTGFVVGLGLSFRSSTAYER